MSAAPKCLWYLAIGSTHRSSANRGASCVDGGEISISIGNG
jgi:hypothetical protein